MFVCIIIEEIYLIDKIQLMCVCRSLSISLVGNDICFHFYLWFYFKEFVFIGCFYSCM